MLAKVEAALDSLSAALPINGAGPYRWLDSHKEDVATLLQADGLREVTALLGLNSATVLKWAMDRQIGPWHTSDAGADRHHHQATVGDSCIAGAIDVSYWKGKADAYRDAVDILAHAKQPERSA